METKISEMLGFGKKNLIGVDIGTSSIKLVELSRNSEHMELQTYGIAQMTYKPKDSSSDQNGKAALTVAVDTLGELLKRSGVKGKKIVASLPTSTVFVTVIDVPKDPNEQQEAIELQAKKVVPIPIEDVTVSWNVIPSVGNDSTKESVLLTAVPNHVIANYIQIFQALKLDAEAIEVEATALTRCLIGRDESTVLILDMGSRASTINLIDKGYIYFSKNINVGGEIITANIAQNLKVNMERAEQFKRSMGFSGVLEEGRMPRSLQPLLNILKEEVEHVLNLARGWERNVEKIILTGGGSRLIGLDAFLSNSLQLPVMVGNPWARILMQEKIKPLAEELGPALAVSIGLAMRTEE